MTRLTTRPVAWCIVSAVLFGAATPAAKLLLGPLSPVLLAGLLYLGAALAVLPAALRNRPARLDRRNVLRLSGAVVAGGVLAPVLLMLGLSGAPASSVALWLNFEPVATAVLAWAIFHEHVGRWTWAGAALVLVAGTILAAPSGFQAGVPALLVAAACVCWAIDNNLTATIDGFTPAQSTLAKGLVAGGVNIALGLLLGDGDLPLGAVGGALAVGAVGYGLSLVLYVGGAQQLGATRSQMLFATAPFFGAVVAWTVLGEPLTGWQVAGGLGMLAALLLAAADRHGHRHRHDPVAHVHAHRHDDDHHDHGHADVPPGAWHTHEHRHAPVVHEHPHQPDLHHRHDH
jgi:drug/metabolite transporter (DMT)-like permease